MYDKSSNIYINNNKYRAKNLIVADFLGKISFVTTFLQNSDKTK